MVSEAVLCIKNARELFERTQAVNIIVWLLIQLVISIIFVYGCIIYHRYTQVYLTQFNSLAIDINKSRSLFSHNNLFSINSHDFFSFSLQDTIEYEDDSLVTSEQVNGMLHLSNLLFHSDPNCYLNLFCLTLTDNTNKTEETVQHNKTD